MPNPSLPDWVAPTATTIGATAMLGLASWSLTAAAAAEQKADRAITYTEQLNSTSAGLRDEMKQLREQVTLLRIELAKQRPGGTP